MTDWSDVAARAAGLAGRLLGRARLLDASGARDLPTIADLLARSAYPGVGEEARHDPTMLERHVRRAAGERMSILARWSAGRLSLLAPVYDEEDCRSLRAIMRGILAGVPVEQRMSGLVPTPSLREAALAELARQPNLSQMVALLAAWAHPYGAAVLAEATHQQPDAFRLQVMLDRRFAERATRAAERAGAPLLEHVRRQLDLANAWTALALASRAVQYEPGELFVGGGGVLDLELFLACARQGTAEAARALLVRRLPRSMIARVLSDDTARWAQEDRALADAMRLERVEARCDPLGVGAVLHYVLRLRAEVRDIARIVWSVALDMPRAVVAHALVSP